MDAVLWQPQAGRHILLESSLRPPVGNIAFVSPSADTATPRAQAYASAGLM